MFSSAAFAASLLLVVIVATTPAHSGYTLEEVNFKILNGVVGSSSRYDDSTNYQPANAFLSQSVKFWHSGRDSEGKGDLAVSFPHLIWYEFESPIIPSRVSFRPRLDGGCGSGGAWCGALVYQFVGTNDRPCNQFSTWTNLCEDLTNIPFQRMTQSKYCRTGEEMKKTFHCVGISVLDASYNGYSCVSMSGIRMWKRV